MNMEPLECTLYVSTFANGTVSAGAVLTCHAGANVLDCGRDKYNTVTADAVCAQLLRALSRINARSVLHNPRAPLRVSTIVIDDHATVWQLAIRGVLDTASTLGSELPPNTWCVDTRKLVVAIGGDALPGGRLDALPTTVWLVLRMNEWHKMRDPCLHLAMELAAAPIEQETGFGAWRGVPDVRYGTPAGVICDEIRARHWSPVESG
jgi:hypothetical protein